MSKQEPELARAPEFSGFESHSESTDKPHTCKFCHKHVWYQPLKSRWYEPGGKELHVKNCPKGQAFYKQRALEYSQARRERREY